MDDADQVLRFVAGCFVPEDKPTNPYRQEIPFDIIRAARRALIIKEKNQNDVMV